MPQLVDKGCKVTFDKNLVVGQDLSHMANKNTGVTSRFRHERSVWMLDAFVKADGKAKAGEAIQDFTRRGRA